MKFTMLAFCEHVRETLLSTEYMGSYGASRGVEIAAHCYQTAVHYIVVDSPQLSPCTCNALSKASPWYHTVATLLFQSYTCDVTLSSNCFGCSWRRLGSRSSRSSPHLRMTQSTPKKSSSSSSCMISLRKWPTSKNSWPSRHDLLLYPLYLATRTLQLSGILLD